MKQEVVNMINNLSSFLDNLESVYRHPYCSEINVEKVIEDLKQYAIDLRQAVENLPVKENEKDDNTKEVK